MGKKRPQAKDAEIVRLLLKHGADEEDAMLDQSPNQSNSNESLMDKLCYYMCSVQDKDVGITFIEHGVSRHQIKPKHIFFLMRKMNDIESAKLIKALALPSDHGRVKFQEKLLGEWEPGVRVEDYRGLYPGRQPAWVDNITYLGWATILGQKEVVRCLLDLKNYGVIPNEIEHTMCLLEATMRGRLGIISVLLDGYRKLDQKKLHRLCNAACKAGRLDVLKYWMKFGLKRSTLHETDEKGHHILSSAVMGYSGRMVLFLMINGITLTNKALNALPLAVLFSNRQSLIKFIIKENNVAPDVGQIDSTQGGNRLLCPQIAAYLALYGFSIDTESGLSQDPIAWQRVRAIQNTVKTACLFHTCIRRVRECLGPVLTGKVRYLPIPELIKLELFRPDLQNLSIKDILNTEFH